MVWYHGTTWNFDEFKIKDQRLNFIGDGIYLSSEHEDSLANYSGLGPDLVGRVEDLYSQLNECGEYSEEEIEDIIVNELCGKHSFVLSCEVDCNIAVVSQRTKEYIDLVSYDENEEPVYTDAYYAIVEALDCFDFDYTDVLESFDLETTLDEIYDACRLNIHFEEWEEVFKEILKKLGYDAVKFEYISDYILMYRNLDYYYCDHLIVFDPNKIKIINREDLKVDTEKEMREFIRTLV